MEVADRQRGSEENRRVSENLQSFRSENRRRNLTEGKSRSGRENTCRWVSETAGPRESGCILRGGEVVPSGSYHHFRGVLKMGRTIVVRVVGVCEVLVRIMTAAYGVLTPHAVVSEV